jgi:OOP family OmpA-OmpF porin
MRTLTLATAAIVLGVSGTLAHAEEQAGQAYITPMATYINPDGNIGGDDLEDGIKGGQLAIGYALEERWNVELAVQRLQLDTETSGADIEQTGIVVNVLNVWNRDNRFSPYLIAGLGYVNDDAGGTVGDENNFQAQAGIGAFTDLFGDRVALRTEAMYRWEDAEDSLSDWMINVGLQIALGSREEEAPPPVAPVAAAAAAPVVDTDSDGDGVVDRLDRCPGTPKGAVVDATGCPLDGDGDGVFDGLDACPTTPPNTKVGPKGCSLTLSLSGVNFENDSAKLLPEGQRILDQQAVPALKGDPAATIEIQGHTDSNGSAAYNMQLGEGRATSVRDYLVSQGIDASRMTVKSFGETEPVADNGTPEGRAENRRVVLKVLTYTQTQ